MSSRNRSPKAAVDQECIPADARRAWLIVCACVFAVSLAVLCWNAAPSVTFHDSGEFAMAAASGGIPHPPGAPTWTILATLFVKLGGFHDPARGTNLLSGLLGAIALALLCGLVQVWVHVLYSGSVKWLPSASGVVSALVLLHSSAFLEQSFITEQYTLQAALLVGMLLVCTAIYLRARADRPLAWLCAFLGLLWGLAIGNHLSQVCLGLLVIWTLWIASERESRLRCFSRLGARCAAGLLLGLTVFLWLPIRSRANPVMDWGNVKTLDRFIWAIARRQWETHPISGAPKNLAADWLASYDPVGQIGIIGLVLLAVGILVLVRRRRMWLGWLAAVAIPYSAGLLLVHMRQEGMEADFIVMYGVLDWHLPEYIAIAIGSGIGFAAVAAWLGRPRFGILAWIWLAVVVAHLTVTAANVIGRESLRHYDAPDRFVREILAPLPPDAAIVSGQENTAFMLGYRKWILDPSARYWIVVGKERPWRVMEDARMAGATPDERKMEYLSRVMSDPNNQPFRVPPVRAEAGRAPRVFLDFMATDAGDRLYIVPTGYLFEFVGRPVSDAEVRGAERRWNERNPNLLRKRPPDAHRLECEAYARLHIARGVYFGRREMWPEAVDAYARALDWKPENGAVWFYYADALDHMGKLDQAVEAYKRAIVCIPMNPEPVYNLAMLYARHARYPEAEQLLAEALRIDPKDARTRASLARVRKILGTP